MNLTKGLWVAYCVGLLLSACTAEAALVITQTPAPTATRTPQPTATVPQIEVDGLQVPDPKVSNPELFDRKSSNSPIVQFADAFGVNPEEVAFGQPEVKIGVDGKQYVVLTTSDLLLTTTFDETGVPLLMAEQGENGEWKWKTATLDNMAQQSGWYFGAFLNLNEDFRSITIDNFGMGNAFIDWNYVQPQKGEWDFSDPDYNINTASQSGMLILANLIWGNNIAEWAKQDPDLRAVMVDYITQVMTHYKGRVKIWNVYNEAQLHGTDDDFWNELDGIEAVRDAYRTARAVDPRATLLYNDYVDLDGTRSRDRLPTFEEVVSQIKQDGNLDAIGLQIVGRPEGSELDKLRKILDALSKYDLPIYITEFSIINGENTPDNLERQAKVAVNVISVLKDYDNVAGIVAFPLEDRISNLIYLPNSNSGLWLKTESGGYIPKPIVYAMMRVLIEEPQQ
jgi:endo-1,4-beta-xylanase